MENNRIHKTGSRYLKHENLQWPQISMKRWTYKLWMFCFFSLCDPLFCRNWLFTGDRMRIKYEDDTFIQPENHIRINQKLMIYILLLIANITHDCWHVFSVQLRSDQLSEIFQFITSEAMKHRAYAQFVASIKPFHACICYFCSSFLPLFLIGALNIDQHTVIRLNIFSICAINSLVFRYVFSLTPIVATLYIRLKER